MQLIPALPASGLNPREARRAEHILFEAMKGFTDHDDGYYRERIGRGTVLEIYEREILDYALLNLDCGNTRLVEAGAGWGMLCILLAVHGFEVIGLTGDQTHCSVFRKLSDHLAAAFPHHQERLHIVEGFFPYALDEAVFTQAGSKLLYATNVIHGFSDLNQDAFLAAALRFDNFVIDVATFGRERDEARRKEFRELLKAGFAIDRSLWQDRLLMMKPISQTQRKEPVPYWLVGQTALLGPHCSGDLATLDGSYRHAGGYSWYVKLPAIFAERGDNSEAPQRSPWRLLEDGVLLGPPHSLHANIVALGHGCYSHWHDHLYFSSSDNSNPLSNKRRYTLAHSKF